MNLIINTTTLSGTGVTQVAVSFIKECVKIPEHNYYVFLSNSVASQLNTKVFPSNFSFYRFESHPLYGLRGFFIRRRIKKILRTISPDCVFSVFGPSCWTPSVPHLQGYAFPYHVYPESPIYKLLSKKEKLYIKIHKMLYCYFLKRNGKYFVCETENVSDRLSVLLNVSRNNVFTVTNTYSSVFENVIDSNPILPIKKKNEFRFLSLCSFMKHKNLEILNEVIPLLKQKCKINVIFVLTIDEQSFERKFKPDVRDNIINVGKVDIKKCPFLYKETDALFLPTLLECFSANYPEAMIMERPILTSNLPFATEVCGKAALYFDPLDPDDICDKIMELIGSSNLYNNLVNNGIEQLKMFDSSFVRAKKYIDCCKQIALV